MRKNCFKAVVLAFVSVGILSGAYSGKAQPVNLVTTNTTWRYNQTGAELGTAWRARSYDDTVSGWEGPGLPLFGFEGNEVQYNNIGVYFQTRFPDPQNPTSNFRTNFYFRTHFTMPSVSAPILAATELVTSNWVDDGAIYYLNGIEFARFNMPGGAVNAATFANGALSEPVFFTTNYVG